MTRKRHSVLRAPSSKGLGTTAVLLGALLAQCQDSTAPAASSRIVFQSDRTGDSEIFSLDTLTGEVDQLTHSPGVDRQPAWSRNHRYVAYVSEGDSAGLHVMRADGTGRRIVPGTTGNDFAPAWSPDGARIALIAATSAGGVGSIRIIRAEGGAGVPVFAGPADRPTWSPDGRRLAFGTAIAGNSSAIFSIRLDSGTMTQLTTPQPDSYDRQAAWSPDGEMIAFVRLTSPGGVNAPQRLYVRMADGQEIPLTTFPAGQDWTPAWSPDGSLIVFAHEVGGQFDLYTIRPTGAELRQITTNGGIQAFPSW